MSILPHQPIRNLSMGIQEMESDDGGDERYHPILSWSNAHPPKCPILHWKPRSTSRWTSNIPRQTRDSCNHARKIPIWCLTILLHKTWLSKSMLLHLLETSQEPTQELGDARDDWSMPFASLPWVPRESLSSNQEPFRFTTLPFWSHFGPRFEPVPIASALPTLRGGHSHPINSTAWKKLPTKSPFGDDLVHVHNFSLPSPIGGDDEPKLPSFANFLDLYPILPLPNWTRSCCSWLRDTFWVGMKNRACCLSRR